jgi:hypothetical protein
MMSAEALTAILPELAAGAFKMKLQHKMKLQDMIDDAFGAKEAPRTPQVATEMFKERQRAFSDRAKEIEVLRQVRLDAADTPRTSFVFEVVRFRGHWRTLHNGKRSSPFTDQAAAILAAKKLARQKTAEGHSVEVILRRADGDSVAQSVDTDECCSN